MFSRRKLLTVNVSQVASILLVLLCQFLHAEVPRPRGVSLSRAPLYNPDINFTCFDGSVSIPFTQVNDDYCDCPDGSDEPGTAACPGGIFYCPNSGHKPLNIRASMVNDGICDCCDGSDEYSTLAKCPNNCFELGKIAREEAVRQAEELRVGNKIRIELGQRGVELKKERREKLSQLQKDRDEAVSVKQEKESLKNQVEEIENAALEKYRKIEEEERRIREEAEAITTRKEATEVFIRFDSDQNGKLHVTEIQTRQTFDKDRNGEVSEDEAKFFLNEKDEIDLEEFISECWSRVKPFLMSDAGLFKPPLPEGQEEVVDYEEKQEVDETASEDDGEALEQDENEEDEDEEAGDKEVSEPPVPSITYDEETQNIINQAKQAREEFESAQGSVKSLEEEIQSIEEYLQKDFGPDDEFATLEGQCFEFTDHEYIYKLCPFDKTVQQPKSNSLETRLGVWSGWTGPESDPYQAMLYDRGQTCWNGPQRITKVKVSCGSENKLTSVSEPNRCEYYFEFVTPAACREMQSERRDELHDEL